MAITVGVRGLGPLGAAALLVGCSALPAVPGSARAQDAPAEPGAAAAPVAPEDPDPGRAFEAAAGSDDDSRLMFEILVAELAGRRGRLDVALEGYLSAAGRTPDPRVAERAARLAAFSADWERAGEAVERWRELAPENPEALELAAQVALREGDAEAAAARFVELVELADAADREGGAQQAVADANAGPEAPVDETDVAFERVAALLQGDPEPALAAEVAERLEAAFPEAAGAALLVARLAMARGEEPPARAALERALALDPTDTATLLLSTRLAAAEGDVDGSLARLEAAVADAPDDRRLRLGQAQLLVEARRTEAAREALEALGAMLDGAEADPEAVGADGLRSADLRLSTAQLALQGGLLELAESGFAELVSAGPHTDQARFQLARLRDAASDPGAAVELYEGVGPSEWFVTAQVRAAELRAAGGELELARERLAELRGVADPASQPRLLTAEGRILQEAGDGAGALEVLDAGVARFPDDAELRYARALAADAAGRPEVLESDLLALIESDPDNAHALNALGYHLAEENVRLDEAEGYLERAIELRADDPAIMDSLGWLRYRQGRPEEAIELLERAHALLPDPEIAAHLGEVLWTEGRREEARAVWDEALAQAPDHEVLGRTVERFLD